MCVVNVFLVSKALLLFLFFVWKTSERCLHRMWEEVCGHKNPYTLCIVCRIKNSSIDNNAKKSVDSRNSRERATRFCSAAVLVNNFCYSFILLLFWARLGDQGVCVSDAFFLVFIEQILVRIICFSIHKEHREKCLDSQFISLLYKLT